MSALAHRYQHWRGTSTGIWRRRAVITACGLRLSWKSRLLKMVFSVAWSAALAFAALHFLIGQLMAPESSVLDYLTGNFNPRIRALLDGIAAWLLLYPEVAVDGLYRATFSTASALYTALSFFAVTLFVPKLISHDLSSQAIIIYNSKALTRLDYLIGKFGIVFVLLSLLHTAPLAASWLVGNVLSPDRTFFMHSLPALLRAMAVGMIATVSLSLLALAVSSLARKAGVATAFWIVLWLVSGVIGAAVGAVFDWGAFLSPQDCLAAIASHLYDLGGALTDAQVMLPFFDHFLQSFPRKAAAAMQEQPAGSIWLPLAFLGGFCALALVAIAQRTRPE